MPGPCPVRRCRVHRWLSRYAGDPGASENALAGQRIDPGRAVLARRVIESDGWFHRCGRKTRSQSVRRLAGGGATLKHRASKRSTGFSEMRESEVFHRILLELGWVQGFIGIPGSATCTELLNGGSIHELVDEWYPLIQH